MDGNFFSGIFINNLDLVPLPFLLFFACLTPVHYKIVFISLKPTSKLYKSVKLSSCEATLQQVVSVIKALPTRYLIPIPNYLFVRPGL